MMYPRARIYSYLASCLAEPAGWLAKPGRDWPLFNSAANLANSSPACRNAVSTLGEIRAEPLDRRRERYQALFAGPGRPRFWLYESACLNGMLLGPQTLAVDRLYRAAGLEPAGAELPDHAALELAFLAYLSEQQTAQPELAGQWKEIERGFIHNHAGRWLPALGRSLVCSNDEVYGPIGSLLAGWIEETIRSSGKARPANRRLWPILAREDGCSLCGFCVQVCPTRCLRIDETEHETVLQLEASSCTGCGKCARACESGALSLRSAPPQPATGRIIRPNLLSHVPSPSRSPLKRSPRARCPNCGKPTVSRAELDFVAQRIGSQAWLEHCLACRSNPMEVIR